jgi:hypothetical protein
LKNDIFRVRFPVAEAISFEALKSRPDGKKLKDLEYFGQTLVEYDILKTDLSIRCFIGSVET